MNAADATGRADAVRQRTTALVETLERTAIAFALPEPPESLRACRRKLADNSYKVLVVGEAKRGKSTFVNALIGRPILPTDVEVATSQVFHVRHARTEAYRLRFEDDSQQEIAPADLPRYGSQVMADTEGIPRLDQLIRWIEVDVPARFLPEGISILDTPGLGALYAAHAQITHRFVPHADAVIFVLDSQAPLGEPEVRFLEEILGVTRNLFFIQTRIDQFRKDAWQAIQARNQDILRQRFGERLENTRVWPISSVNLYKAAVSGDDDYLIVSRHKELEPALKAFLFRTAGWVRTGQAVLAADEFHEQSRATLSGRLRSLAEGAAPQQQTLHELAQRRLLLDASWGGEGGKRKELLDRLGDAADRAQQSFSQQLGPGGPVAVGQQEQIDALQSIEQAKRLAESISAQTVAEASRLWREATAHFHSACVELLEPFLREAREAFSTSVIDDHQLAVRSGKGLDLDDQGFLRTLRASEGLFVGATTAASAGYVLSVLIGTSWFPPLAVAGVIGVGLWGAVFGWKVAGASQLKAAKEELHRHLGEVLQRIHEHYLGEAGTATAGGLVGDFFRRRLRELTTQVAGLVAQKRADLQREIAFQTDQVNLDGEQRENRASELRRQLAKWDLLGESIRAVRAELQDLEQAHQAPATGDTRGGGCDA